MGKIELGSGAKLIIEGKEKENFNMPIVEHVWI